MEKDNLVSHFDIVKNKVLEALKILKKIAILKTKENKIPLSQDDLLQQLKMLESAFDILNSNLLKLKKTPGEKLIDELDILNDHFYRYVKANYSTQVSDDIFYNIELKYDDIIKKIESPNFNFFKKEIKKVAFVTALLAAFGYNTISVEQDLNQNRGFENSGVKTEKIEQTQKIFDSNNETLAFKVNTNKEFLEFQQKEIYDLITQFSQKKNTAKYQKIKKLLDNYYKLGLYNPNTYDLTISNSNKSLTDWMHSMAKSENVNFELIVLLSLVESTYGKDNESNLHKNTNARAYGPLQVMRVNMKAFLWEKYKAEFNNDEESFYNSTAIQLRTGFKVLKETAARYSINISYNSQISIHDLIMLAGDYNFGAGNMRKKSKLSEINNEKYESIKSYNTKGEQVYDYIRKLLMLNDTLKSIDGKTFVGFK